jgi:hypothetical protein
MKAKIYVCGKTSATLTTESPSSHYGIPVLRLEGSKVLDPLPDLGPADRMPSGLTAADLVVACAMGELYAGFGGRIVPMSRRTKAAARAFLAQWPKGPQFGG